MKFFTAATLLAAVASALPYNGEVPSLLAERATTCVPDSRIVSIVIDASGSNSDTDPNNLRLSGAKQIVNYLTPASAASATKKADKVAVVEFTTRGKVDYALGDPSGASKPIDRIRALGGTDVAEGLSVGIDQVIKGGAANTGNNGLVMFTDGLNSDASGKRKMLAQIARAKALGIRISWGHLYQPQTNPGKKPSKGLIGSIFDLLWPWGNSNNNSNDWGGPIDPEVSAAVLATGGTVSMIATPQAQLDFVTQVLKNGLTTNDGKCSGLDDNEGGGPVVPDVSTLGLCSNNAKSTFTYSPKSTNEDITFVVELVSKTNPVTLTATYTNKATGDTTKVTINKDQPQGQLIGKAAPGNEVELVITSSGADDSQTCQYSVGLIAKPQGSGSSTPVVPTTTSTPVVPSSSSTPVVPTTSSAVPTTSSAAPTTSSAVPTTSSAVPTTSSAVPTTSSAVPTTSSAVPTTVPTTSSAVPTTSSAVPTTSSAVPTTSSAVPTTVPTTSSAVPTTSSAVPTTVPTTSSAVPTTSSAVPTTTSTPVVPSVCPTLGPAETVVSTVVQTQTQTVAGPTVTVPGPATTVTVTPSQPPTATASVCMCACTVAGAKPFPKFEL